jgi:hypothetical protein
MRLPPGRSDLLLALLGHIVAHGVPDPGFLGYPEPHATVPALMGSLLATDQRERGELP